MRTLRGNSNRYQVRLPAVALLLAVLGLVAAGCGGSSASSAPKSGVAGARHSTSSVAVKTRKLKGLGVVLVNTEGADAVRLHEGPAPPRHVHGQVRAASGLR